LLNQPQHNNSNIWNPDLQKQQLLMQQALLQRGKTQYSSSGNQSTICPFTVTPKQVIHPEATPFTPHGFQEVPTTPQQVEALKPWIYSYADTADLQTMTIKQNTFTDALSGKFIPLKDFSGTPQTLSAWLDAYLTYCSLLLASFHSQASWGKDQSSSTPLPTGDSQRSQTNMPQLESKALFAKQLQIRACLPSLLGGAPHLPLQGD
jgi:hypothetical protein